MDRTFWDLPSQIRDGNWKCMLRHVDLGSGSGPVDVVGS